MRGCREAGDRAHEDREGGVLVTRSCGCRGSEKWPGLRLGGLESQEQRMRGNDQDRADDSFSGERAVLLEKGKWPQGGLQRVRGEQSPPQGQRCPQKCRFQLRQEGWRRPGMCSAQTTAHTGSSGSGGGGGGRRKGAQGKFRACGNKGKALRWLKGSASIMDEPPI